MKPTKNKFHCPACQQTKMLFATKEEAIRFLKYNADDIEHETGKRPVRTYYCTACGGWHITSKPQSSDYHSLVKRYGETDGKKIFDEVSAIKGRRHGIKEGLCRKIKDLRHIMRFETIDLERCQSLINELIGYFETVMGNGLEEETSVMKLFSKFSHLCFQFIEKKRLQTQIA